MLFVYKSWENFCKELSAHNIHSIPAREVHGNSPLYLILKHDVETNVKSAYAIACIEHQYGHRGSFYVQAYLLKSPQNIKLLKRIQEYGHEVSYHYDVMDSTGGDIDKAIEEFEKEHGKIEK